MHPRRKPSKGFLATREASGPMRCPEYLKWLRGCACWACGANAGRMEAAHYRGSDVPAEDRGGVGLKPADCWAVPLCHDCHALQHTEGHDAFDRRAGAKMRDAAAASWSYWLYHTDAGRRWRERHGT